MFFLRQFVADRRNRFGVAEAFLARTSCTLYCPPLASAPLSWHRTDYFSWSNGQERPTSFISACAASLAKPLSQLCLNQAATTYAPGREFSATVSFCKRRILKPCCSSLRSCLSSLIRRTTLPFKFSFSASVRR